MHTDTKVEQFGKNPVLVPITYYRDQQMYDKYGRDEGPFGWPNAVARKLAYELGKRGIAYSFRYPDDGAVSTPGSNYQAARLQAAHQIHL